MGFFGHGGFGHGFGHGGFGHGFGHGTSTAVILVLFILIAIVGRAGLTDVVGV
jgi:hypothetical protein